MDQFSGWMTKQEAPENSKVTGRSERGEETQIGYEPLGLPSSGTGMGLTLGGTAQTLKEELGGSDLASRS